MKKIVLMAILAALFLAFSCEKVIDKNAENPFTTTDPTDTATNKLGAATIQGLHQNVFSVRCANPSCHDGSFEPDYRTVQSTYSSLVYHPVTKNDSTGSYTYRVFPGKPEESWIMHRVATDDEVLGRMPLYADPLSTEQVENLRTWIKNGARDMFGNLPQFPNLAPTVHGYQALDANNNRVDTTRTNGWASAMVLQQNTAYTLVFYVTDDSTKTENLKNQMLEFSLDRDNFTPFASLGLTKLWDDVTVAQLNTANLPTGQVVFFRYSLEDEQGAATQMPNDQSEYWWKENFSLIIP